MPTSPTTRDDIPAYLTALGLTGVGAEIGTERGFYAERILMGWPGVLHCVDPWLHQPGWHDLVNRSQKEQDAIKREAERRLRPWRMEGRCIIHHTTSVEASTHDWARDLDFVYLDARHDAPNCLTDLVTWYPHVKSGGLLMGHDYLDGQIGPTEFGVKTAVAKFCHAQGYDVFRDILVTEEQGYPSWILRVR